MLNTRELESRWLKYKIKSFIPHTIIMLSSIIIIVILTLFINIEEDTKTSKLTYNEEEKQELQQNVVTKTLEEPKQLQSKTSNEVYAIAKPTFEKKLSDNENSLTLSPSLDFIKKMQHSNVPYYNHKPVQKVKKTPTKESAKQIIEEVQDLTVEEPIEIVEEEVKKVTINRRNIADDIKHIIKRFKKNNNPALSLFVAKKYYELGDYHKAYNYALITNQINSDIEASWIVFSKSLVKLNEKDMAIKTLKEYIESSHSSTAQILLDEIIAGKFK